MRQAADPRAAQLAASATGVLAEFNRAGLLGVADVHVARRLGALGGERDESVLLAVALAVRAVRQGSVSVELATAAGTAGVEGLPGDAVAALPWPEPAAWAEAVAASPLTGDDAAPGPLRLVNGLLYLDRYWRQQEVIAQWVDAALGAPAGPDQLRGDALRAALAALFPAPAPDLQRLAAAVATQRRFMILAGGPGTGKTWTVARILALLQAGAGGRLRIALAAPTGKAAARLQEAIAEAVTAGAVPAQYAGPVQDLAAATLHRLLGARPQTGRFRFNRTNHLPHDLVVVDEASMVSLTLMSRLMEALRPGCRLILVGDPDQLASVEVGAVLGDLFARTPAGMLPPGPDGPLDGAVAADLAALDPRSRERAVGAGVVRLTRVFRFPEPIRAVAEAIRSGRPERLRSALAAAQEGGWVEFVPLDAATARAEGLAGLRADVVAAGAALVAAARAGRAEDALEALGAHQLLCAHRHGPHGVSHWGLQAEEWISQAVAGYGSDGPWYLGRPLIVTENDHQLRLYNGDTGVVVATAAGPRAVFRLDGKPREFPTNQLGAVATMQALSIHRSQGSQYATVTVVLPPADSPLMTRELLYTAVTRAQRRVRIIGPWESLERAVLRPIQRSSGLRGPRTQPPQSPSAPSRAPSAQATSGSRSSAGH